MTQLSVYSNRSIGVNDHAVAAVVERHMTVGVRISDARRQCIRIDTVGQWRECLDRPSLRGRDSANDCRDDGLVGAVDFYNGW
ncbi:hypothetical protein Hhis01_01497 [Haloarcula hispanica]